LPGRPALMLQNLITQQAITPAMMNMVRWQNHWHVVPAELDVLPERLRRPHRDPGDADRTGHARRAYAAAINAVWYIVVYGSSAMVLLSRVTGGWRFPMVGWFVAYGCLLRYFVPDSSATGPRDVGGAARC